MKMNILKSVQLSKTTAKAVSKVLVGFASASLCLGIGGCNFKKTQMPSSDPDPGVHHPLQPPIGTPDSGVRSNPQSQDWDETILQKDQTILQVKTLRAPLREELKRKFNIPTLEPIRSDYAGGYNLYRIPNREEAKGYVFIEPKVFVYGTAQGGNVLTVTSAGGQTVSLTFPISFIDGLNPVIPAYSGKGGVSIPEGLRIPNVQELKNDLRQKLEADVTLQALPTCPRSLSLVYTQGNSLKRFLLKPTLPLDRRCTMNEFFTVSVTSGRSEIMDLVQNALEDGLGVQLSTQFQVEYRTPIAIYGLKLNPNSLYEKVKRQFVAFAFGSGVNPSTYLSYQINPALHRLLVTEIEQLGASAAWFPSSQGIQALEDGFFTEVTGDPSCPAPNRCFRVKDESEINLDEPIQLFWVENQTLGVSEPLSSVTFVRGLAESYPIHVAGQLSQQTGVPVVPGVPSKEVCNASQNNMPGCPGFSCELFPDNVYCKTRSRKAVVHQFQIFPGAKLKLAFDRITQWGYELPVPREDTPEAMKKGEVRCADSRVLKDACVEYAPDECVEYLYNFCAKPKDECDETKKLFESQCKDEVIYETGCGFLGMGHCDQQVKSRSHSCSEVEVGETCLRYKTHCETPVEPKVCARTTRKCKRFVEECNQYTVDFFAKYTYSEPWIRPKTIDIAQGATLEELWDGLDLEFSWLNEDGRKTESLTCPLKAFPHVISGYSITLTLQNQEGENPCKPFNEWNVKEGRWPEVAIINHISFERKYLCGFLEWTHSVNIDSKLPQRTVDRLEYTCPESGEKSDHPIVRSYQPIIDLDGSISILGRSLDTASAQRHVSAALGTGEPVEEKRGDE